MRARKYKGREMHALLETVKGELGEDAEIISTSHLPDRSIELVAARRAASAPSESGATIQLRHELSNDGISAPFGSDRGTHIAELPLLESALVGQGVERSLIREICAGASIGGSVASLEPLLTKGLSYVFRAESRIPFSSKVVALVGATGVGKTTTIAKLAARLREAFGISIGLISADSYRVGAGYHLQTYATLLNLPFLSLDPTRNSRYELSRCVNAFSDLDLILIDTPGCSGREVGRIEQIGEDLDAVGNVESLLVIPAPGNSVDLKASIRGFSRLAFDRVILSKLDESGFMGPALNALAMCEKPLAFFTTGQRVPEDIEPASHRRLAWMLTRTIH